MGQNQYLAVNLGIFGRSGRHAASTGANQRQRINAERIDRHCVRDAHDLGDRGVLAHHGRVHTLLDPLGCPHRDTSSLTR